MNQNTKDRITIEDLEIFASHGVFPEENVLGQKFLVSAVLYTDTRQAGRTDDLEASIDYGAVSAFINEYVRNHTFKLLEKLAESLAEALLLGTPGLEGVELTVKKPWAPVGLPLKTVSVCIRRRWHTAYIALGSNMGDREGYLRGAAEKLGKANGCEVEQISDFIETPPYGVTDQADFLNACLELRTLLTPRELLDTLHKIEQEAGRERIMRWGPRTLDLDIIFYDDLICEEKDLCIPHVEMHKRKFVLEPLCGIAPYKRHPVYGKTVHEMLEEVSHAL